MRGPAWQRVYCSGGVLYGLTVNGRLGLLERRYVLAADPISSCCHCHSPPHPAAA